MHLKYLIEYKKKKTYLKEKPKDKKEKSLKVLQKVDLNNVRAKFS